VTTALSAAKATGLIVHTTRCRTSGLASCVCHYHERLSSLADKFARYADGRAREIEDAERIVQAGLSGEYGHLRVSCPALRYHQEDASE
jgi:hypothetical protein